jgi:hypothetical protein
MLPPRSAHPLRIELIAQVDVVDAAALELGVTLYAGGQVEVVVTDDDTSRNSGLLMVRP